MPGAATSAHVKGVPNTVVLRASSSKARAKDIHGRSGSSTSVNQFHRPGGKYAASTMKGYKFSTKACADKRPRLGPVSSRGVLGRSLPPLGA